MAHPTFHERAIGFTILKLVHAISSDKIGSHDRKYTHKIKNKLFLDAQYNIFFLHELIRLRRRSDTFMQVRRHRTPLVFPAVHSCNLSLAR